jgi:hypothetical protein
MILKKNKKQKQEQQVKIKIKNRGPQIKMLKKNKRSQK